MPKSKFSLILILSFVFLFITVIAFYIFYFRSNYDRIDSAINESNVRVTEDASSNEEQSDYLTEFLEKTSDTSGQSAFTKLNWSWDVDMLKARVLSVDMSERTLLLEPLNVGDPVIDTLRVGVSCPRDKTAALSSINLNLLKEDIDIFDEIKERSILYTYCENGECNSIGKECIFILPESPADAEFIEQ